MEDIGEDLEIVLLPVADEDHDAELRVKPSKPAEFKKTPFQADYGDQLITRAIVAGLTHGTLAPGEDPATLLIFEFRFISMQTGRRFTSCTITVTFEDSDGNGDLCPEVWRVCPEGVFALQKTSQIRNVKITGNAGINVGFSAAGANAGATWEMDRTENVENWARLSGTRKELGPSSNKDDAVVWAMGENTGDKSGVPTFLRAAVLLRREAEVPFNFLIKIRAQVDMGAAVERTLFGKKKVEKVVPVKIDAAVDPKALKVATADPKVVDLTKMDELDLGKLADVTLVTVL